MIRTLILASLLIGVAPAQASGAHCHPGQSRQCDCWCVYWGGVYLPAGQNVPPQHGGFPLCPAFFGWIGR